MSGAPNGLNFPWSLRQSAPVSKLRTGGYFLYMLYLAKGISTRTSGNMWNMSQQTLTTNQRASREHPLRGFRAKRGQLCSHPDIPKLAELASSQVFGQLSSLMSLCSPLTRDSAPREKHVLPYFTFTIRCLPRHQVGETTEGWGLTPPDPLKGCVLKKKLV